MTPFIFCTIFSGIFIALVKIAIEYDWWKKPKNEILFHGIGFCLVSVIIVKYFIATDYNYYATIILILSYWNTFEIAGKGAGGWLIQMNG